MTRKEAMKKLMAETKCSIDQIILIQRALKWYDDQINDLYWKDHIRQIVELYVYVQTKLIPEQESKNSLKHKETK